MNIAKFLALDFGVQTVGFAFSAYHKTEKWYDATGAFTYQALTLAMLFSSRGHIQTRSLIAGSFVLVWSARLGYFLYERVKTHPDKRFDKIKTNPARFAVAWFIQGVWVAVTILPPFLCITQKLHSPFGWLDLAGVAVWGTGFAMEAIADYQKQQFKSKHPDKFCSEGLWAYSRYPNYFGEVTLWCGMSMLCWGGLQGVHRFSVLSPVFIALLITNISGVNLSEKSQSKRYGQLEEYQEYVKNTSKFFPWFPKSNVKRE